VDYHDFFFSFFLFLISFNFYSFDQAQRSKIRRNSEITNSISSRSESDVEKKERPDRVLVAEDNPVNQLILQHFFRSKFSLECVIAPNGMEAVLLYSSTPFPIVIMDLQMPILSGTEVFLSFFLSFRFVLFCFVFCFLFLF